MTVDLTRSLSEGPAFVRAVEGNSGQKVADCYQCGKCTAGCPVAFATDVPPHRVIRFLQLGLKDQALSAGMIWLCATCSTCTARCPRGVDLARIMDALRIAALEEGKIERSRHVALFNRLFLSNVRKYGRVHETELALRLNLGKRRPFADAPLGIGMLKRGKLRFAPSRAKDFGHLRRLMEKLPR